MSIYGVLIDATLRHQRDKHDLGLLKHQAGNDLWLHS